MGLWCTENVHHWCLESKILCVLIEYAEQRYFAATKPLRPGSVEDPVRCRATTAVKIALSGLITKPYLLRGYSCLEQGSRLERKVAAGR